MTTPPDATADDDKKRAAASRSRTVTARDGLRLHCRDYGDPKSPWTPVLCLPGLSRSARDFADLAGHLAGHRHRPRRVVAVDYRGRGESAWADDPSAYNPFTELDDVFLVQARIGFPPAQNGNAKHDTLLMRSYD